MKKISFTSAAIVAALTLIVPAPSGAAGTVSVSATQSGGTLSVSGSATFTDQPFVTLGTDPTGDTFAPGQDQLGLDLVAGSMATKANGQILVRWSVTALPPGTNGMPTGHAYGAAFCVNEDSCFDVDAQRMGLGAANTTGYGVLWRCADASCTPADQSFIKDGLPVAFDATTKTITVTLGSGDIGATPGATIQPVPAAAAGSFFTWTGDATVTVFADFGDGIFIEDPFTVARKEVALAVADRGLAPSSVAYGPAITPAGNGSFAASLSVAGMTGDKAVYARACFGSNNCAYTSVDVTLA